MAYIITDTCTKDELCVEACPTDCIHPKKDEEKFEAATQLYVAPEGCIDCGACVPVCPTNSIFIVDEVPGRQTGIHREERRVLRVARKVILWLRSAAMDESADSDGLKCAELGRSRTVNRVGFLRSSTPTGGKRPLRTRSA